ncbi:hypothetical protein [Ensifer aridi]|uniref:hypothetical protein n=1 Tax=Ensifer aridi TaxID=1708715 RepID=UPI000A11A2E1|nr:hypothetical protein [Ensifer aridi]
MSEANSPLYRVEIVKPDSSTDCFPCVEAAELPELIMPLISNTAQPAGSVVLVYDYHLWKPGFEHGLVRAISILR